MNNRIGLRRGCMVLGWLFFLVPLATEPVSSAAELGSNTASTPQLLREMAGKWTVKEWMWTGPGTKPIPLPAAIAYRQLIGGKVLEERMTGLPGSAEAFTRISYFDYNSMSGRYEYFSIDSRLPQMMNERSSGPAAERQMIELYGGTFVAPQWGSARNVPFRYRIVVGAVQGTSQTVELYLTPMPAGESAGFLAFKYVYARVAAP